MKAQTHDFMDGKGPVPAHRHIKGEGWVADTAHVDKSAHIGSDARVYGAARVYKHHPIRWLHVHAAIGRINCCRVPRLYA